MTSHVSLALTAVLWMTFSVRSCSMIPSYDMLARCNQTIDLKKENIHLAQIVFNMSLQGTVTENVMSCAVVIVPWFSKPNIQYYFTEMNLPLCVHSWLQIRKSTDGDSYRYPSDFTGTKCRDSVTRKLVDKEHTVTGSYLKILITWSTKASRSTSFTMVFNTYGTGDCEGNDDHLCDNERCIVKNITCMKYNTCGDQSDCGSSTDTDSETIADGQTFAIAVFQVIFGIIFFGVTCCIMARFFKERRSCDCMRPVCDCLDDCLSCLLHSGRACLPGLRGCGRAFVSYISQLPGRCRDLYREKCGSCECRGRQEGGEDGTTGSLPRQQPVLQTRFSSISHTNEYADSREPEVVSTELEINDVIEIGVHDPPPPYTDDLRRNRDRPLPSIPPREEFEELPPPPPHYEEVMGQPDKYMAR